ncbi:phosphohydrolase [Mesorhizobium sp. L-8-10]|uniref:NUDIX domain-containing protein n=1 Tax=unclassified Mesorhizobium TaxID=325217 RepID=UPI0019269B11|nr:MULTISPECIES: NUDIX domain-containing protein [unclassified Mesorhizobium]BCH22495.1 phosphohydrolase [Mesorhizobium sp. L-8-3]BCH30309.1 phosphohydrolase [Mesorhizobium sp. L-8-10]
MPRTSAGLLVFRREAGFPEVLLVHPGGPFWRKRDEGAWSIPKGEYGPGEDAQAAAFREFAEELGAVPPAGPPFPLGEAVQAGGKRVVAYAVEGAFDVNAVRSNSFEMEWPPGSGRRELFPEVDRAGWFTLPAATLKIIPGQRPLLERLEVMLAG